MSLWDSAGAREGTRKGDTKHMETQVLSIYTSECLHVLIPSGPRCSFVSNPRLGHIRKLIWGIKGGRAGKWLDALGGLGSHVAADRSSLTNNSILLEKCH